MSETNTLKSSFTNFISQTINSEPNLNAHDKRFLNDFMIIRAEYLNRSDYDLESIQYCKDAMFLKRRMLEIKPGTGKGKIKEVVWVIVGV